MSVFLRVKKFFCCFLAFFGVLFVSLFYLFLKCFLNFILLLYFWLHWVFVAACGLSLVAVSRRLLSICNACASHFGRFSYCRARGVGVGAQ